MTLRVPRGSPLADRLLAWAEFDPNSGCWLWSGSTTKWGYGSIRVTSGPMLAHRAAWLAFRGSEPGDQLVCHRCDTPACINPDHLFLGTNADNVADRHAKGRSRGGSCPGATHGEAVLTEDDVRRIRAMARERFAPQRVIAALFGISQGHVSDLLNNKRWTHLEQTP